MLKRTFNRVVRRLGYVQAPREFPPDFDPAAIETIKRVRRFTMTKNERIYALITAVRYVSRHDIPGAIVECGVWRGGSMMTVALTLQQLGRTDVDLYLFDTFEGMAEPSTADVTVFGQPADDVYKKAKRIDTAVDYCYASLDEVRQNVLSTGYPADKIHFVKGKVEDTIPAHSPGQISLLRLDTDWYSSTAHELHHLYPALSPKGVLIIDDYGHWAGSRQATDEYLDATGAPLLLSRIDYTARMAVKPGA